MPDAADGDVLDTAGKADGATLVPGRYALSSADAIGRISLLDLQPGGTSASPAKFSMERFTPEFGHGKTIRETRQGTYTLYRSSTGQHIVRLKDGTTATTFRFAYEMKGSDLSLTNTRSGDEFVEAATSWGATNDADRALVNTIESSLTDYTDLGSSETTAVPSAVQREVDRENAEGLLSAATQLELAGQTVFIVMGHDDNAGDNVFVAFDVDGKELLEGDQGDRGPIGWYTPAFAD